MRNMTGQVVFFFALWFGGYVFYCVLSTDTTMQISAIKRLIWVLLVQAWFNMPTGGVCLWDAILPSCQVVFTCIMLVNKSVWRGTATSNPQFPHIKFISYRFLRTNTPLKTGSALEGNAKKRLVAGKARHQSWKSWSPLCPLVATCLEAWHLQIAGLPFLKRGEW